MSGQQCDYIKQRTERRVTAPDGSYDEEIILAALGQYVEILNQRIETLEKQNEVNND